MLDLSLVKIAVLMALAVMIFGPEKVPALIADAMRLIRTLQTFARTGTEELKQGLGPEFADLRPEDLHPRALVARALTTAAPDMPELDKAIRETVQPIGQQLRDDLHLISRPTEPQPHKLPMVSDEH